MTVVRFVVVLFMMISLNLQAEEDTKMYQAICRAGVLKNPKVFLQNEANELKELMKKSCENLKSKAEAICRAGLYSNPEHYFAQETDHIFVSSVCGQVEAESEAICLAAFYSSPYRDNLGLKNLIGQAEDSCSDLK